MVSSCESTPHHQERKSPRTNMELRVDFRICGRETKRESAYTKTLGGGGLMINTRAILSAGTKVEMNLYYNSLVIPFEAEVVWVNQVIGSGLPRVRCGFQYIKKSDDDFMHIHYILQSKQQDGAAQL